MKESLQLLTVFLCLCIANNTFSQVVRPKVPANSAAKPVPATGATTISPFSKGNWTFVNETNIDYYNYKFERDKASDLSIIINPKYFFADHIAVGVEAKATATSSKGSSVSMGYSSYYAHLTLTYGTRISNKINVFATVAAGPEHGRSKIDDDGRVNTIITKTFDINGTVGVPVLLEQGGFTYLTPFVKYDTYNGKLGDHNLYQNTLAFGLKLETYFNAAFWKKAGTGTADLSKGKYSQGSSMLDYNSMSNIGFSKRTDQQPGSLTPPTKTNLYSLGIGGYYYFIDNVAGGLNIDISGKKSSSGRSYSVKDNRFTIQPTIMANAPVESALHNLFILAGYGFGKDNYNGSKSNLTNISVRAGYNLFLTKNISLTPKLGYQQDKEKRINGSNNGTIYKNSGFAAELGIRAWLNFLSK